MQDPAENFSLAGPDSELEATLVPWDTSLLGFPVGQINRFNIGNGSSPSKFFLAFEDWRDTHGMKLVSFRTRHDALQETMFLESRGFCFVEMVYGLTFRDLKRIAYPEDIVLEKADLADLDAIQTIARLAFETGRFNIDPRLAPELGGRRYAGWVNNSFHDPKHEIIKAVLDGEIVGFFIIEQQNDGLVYWHLTAIAPGRQGQGIGRQLWQAMMMRHRRNNMAEIKTTVSARNTPVLNLYSRLGFRFESPMMTFHWVSP